MELKQDKKEIKKVVIELQQGEGLFTRSKAIYSVNIVLCEENDLIGQRYVGTVDSLDLEEFLTGIRNDF